MTPPTPAPTRRKTWWLLAAAVLAVAAVTGGVFWYAHRGPGPLQAAVQECNRDPFGTDLADGGKTLIINGVGDQMDTGAVQIDTIGCILRALDTPAAVVSHMDQTRGSDGRQTDQWDGFEAAWTYTPDDGLDITIRQD